MSPLPTNEYVEVRNGGYYVAGTRVSLDSIVYSFKDGESPETIRHNFPSLTLEQVYGAITFHLGNQRDVEADIAEREREEDAFTAAHPPHPEVKMKFDRMRQQAVSRRS